MFEPISASSASSPYGPAARGPGEFAPQELFDILGRRRWSIVQGIVFALVVGLAMVVATPAVYSASARLLVETPGSLAFYQVDGRSALAPLQTGRSQLNLGTQLEVLRAAPFRARIAGAVPQEHRGDPVSLAYDLMGQTSIITVTAEGATPETVAVWANTAAREYVELTKESNKSAVIETRRYIENTATRAEEALRAVEGKLLKFTERTRMADSEEERSIRVREAVDVEARARDTQNELLAVETRLRGVQTALGREPEFLTRKNLTPNPEARALREELSRLRAERAAAAGLYTDESPRLRSLDAQIESLRSQIEDVPSTIAEVVTSYNPEQERLVAQVKELTLQRDALRSQHELFSASAGAKTGSVSQYVPWQVQLAQLQRERSLAEKTYMDYSEKLRDLQVRERAIPASASVMEGARVPGAPVRPQKVRDLGLSLLVGLALGVAMAFLQEYLDDRVNTTEDVERATALPTLGVIPTVRGEVRPLLTGHDPFSSIVESFRSLRTSIHYTAIDQQVRTLLVTSSHAREGKSTTSANLAIAMAQEGKRVVLLDGDLRHPTVAKIFDVDRSVGLTNVLAGELSLEAALQETEVKGLRVLGCGPMPPNPAEILSSRAMQALLEELQSYSDLIIVDTPPVLPVTDTQILAGRADGVVLVVEAGETRRGALRQSCQILHQTKVRVMGIVLNKIDQNSKGYYYYRYSYRGGYYGDYYGERGQRTLESRRGESPARLPGSPRPAAGSENEKALPGHLSDWE